MSLFEDLLGRPPATEEVPIVLDRAAHTAAQQRLDAAAQALQLAVERGEFDTAAERAEVQAARAALAEVPRRMVTVQALIPARWQELVDEHPAPAGSDDMWDVKSFRPAVLAECVVPPDDEPRISVAQWRQIEVTQALSAGELNALFVAAVNLNASVPRVSLGKG
jgi:hypothetical protein